MRILFFSPENKFYLIIIPGILLLNLAFFLQKDSLEQAVQDSAVYPKAGLAGDAAQVAGLHIGVTGTGKKGPLRIGFADHIEDVISSRLQTAEIYCYYYTLYRNTLEEFMPAVGKGSGIGSLEAGGGPGKIVKVRYLLIFNILSLSLLTGYAVFSIKRRKRDYRQFRKIATASKGQEQDMDAGGKESHCQPAHLPKALMSEEAEKLILEKLSDFEQGIGFLGKNITLSVICVKLGVNNKYLSHVINKHKGKDFNTYINELRIGYIIRMMESHPAYLHYNINHLAQECGFSSHSKFTAFFRQFTGMTPSVFKEGLIHGRVSV